MFRSTLARLFAIACLLTLLAARAPAAEFRGLWIEAWSPGLLTPEQTTATVNYAKACRFNAIVVEVRKVADALYDSAYEPRADNLAPGYDPLADIITKARAQGIEVHAWVVANRVWYGASLPTDPKHLVNAHPEWLARDAAGNLQADNEIWCDPGHPDAAQRLTDVCLDILSKYDVDGISLDYIRSNSIGWGCNETSLARFAARYGGSGSQITNDARWRDWAVEQVNQQVRKVYISAMAVKPKVKISASVWWTASAGKAEVLQDWEAWTQGHYIDFVAPMAYTADRALFSQWIADDQARAHGRHVYMLQGSFLCSIPETINQLSDVRALGGIGPCVYSYQAPNVGTADPAGLQAALASQLFTEEAAIPEMDWKTHPTTGFLRGTLTSGGQPVDGATVTVGGKTATTDGKGFYAVFDLPPGTHTLQGSAEGCAPGSVEGITIRAGEVTTANLALTPRPEPAPVISYARMESTTGTSAVIVWDTDLPSDSLVEFGLDSSLGNQSPLDAWRVTHHRICLIGLRLGTTYRFRVLSKTPHTAVAASAILTFRTAETLFVPDVIVDDSAAGAVQTGSWSIGTLEGGYGSGYHYAKTSAQENAAFRWIPNLLAGGSYEVSVWYREGTNRSAAAPFAIPYKGRPWTITVNQQTNGRRWNLLGAFPFSAGTEGYVKLGNATGETDLVVMADAVKFHYLADTQAPVLSNPTVAETTEHTATIRWTTDKPADTGVVHGKTDEYGLLSAYDAAKTTSHEVTLTGLEPGTIYHFQCQSADDAGNLTVSADLTFSTTRVYASPTEFLRPGWNLVSIPADPAPTDPSNPSRPTALEVFGSALVEGTSFQWWSNDAPGGGYRLYSPYGGWTGPILRGSCYWLMREPMMPPAGLSIVGYESLGDFPLEIRAHSQAPFWIMFGTPFAREIPCESVTFRNTAIDPRDKGWKEAYGLKMVESIALGFDASQARFFTAGPADYMVERSTLQPWFGYWLLVNRPEALTITFPKP